MTLFKYLMKKFLLAFLGALSFFSLLLILGHIVQNVNRTICPAVFLHRVILCN